MPRTQEAPVLALGAGPVIPAAIRTTLQGAVVEALIRLVMVVPNPDLAISDGDLGLIRIIGLAVVTVVQNLIEKQAGRQLLGRAPAPAVRPPDHV